MSVTEMVMSLIVQAFVVVMVSMIVVASVMEIILLVFLVYRFQ